MAEGCKQQNGLKQKLSLREDGSFEVRTSHSSNPFINPFVASLYPREAVENPDTTNPFTKDQIRNTRGANGRTLLNFLNRHTDSMFNAFGSIVEKEPTDPVYGIKNKNGKIQIFEKFEDMHTSITQNPLEYMQTDSTPESNAVHPLQQATPGTAKKVIKIGYDGEKTLNLNTSSLQGEISFFDNVEQPQFIYESGDARLADVNLNGYLEKTYNNFSDNTTNTIGTVKLAYSPIDPSLESVLKQRFRVNDIVPMELFLKTSNTEGGVQNVLLILSETGAVLGVKVRNYGELPTRLSFADAVTETDEDGDITEAVIPLYCPNNPIPVLDYIRSVHNMVGIVPGNSSAYKEFSKIEFTNNNTKIIFDTYKGREEFVESLYTDMSYTGEMALQKTDLGPQMTNDLNLFQEVSLDRKEFAAAALNELKNPQINRNKDSKIIVPIASPDGSTKLRIATFEPSADIYLGDGETVDVDKVSAADIIIYEKQIKKGQAITHSDLNQFYQGIDSASGYELNLQCSNEFASESKIYDGNEKITGDSITTIFEDIITDNDYLLTKNEKIDMDVFSDVETEITAYRSSEFPEAMLFKKGNDAFVIFFKLTAEGFIEKYSIGKIDKSTGKLKSNEFVTTQIDYTEGNLGRATLENLVNKLREDISMKPSERIEGDFEDKTKISSDVREAAKELQEKCGLAGFRNYSGDNNEKFTNFDLFYNNLHLSIIIILMVIILIFFSIKNLKK